MKTALEIWMNENPGYKDTKLHMTVIKNMVVKDKGQSIAPGLYRVNGKPFGMWYGVGFSWFHFLLSEYTSGIKPFIYKIDIEPSQVLFLKDNKQAEEFDAKYCPEAEKSPAWGGFNTWSKSNTSYRNVYHDKGVRQECIFPDWMKVAKDYTGIELDPHKVYPGWADEWAVHSGCIWSKSTILNMQLISQYNGREFINANIG